MIVIPMAGLSSRFQRAGYTLPKYMLEAHGRSLFAHSVASFEALFDSEPFMFICRDEQDTAGFVAREATSLGIRAPHCVILDAPTRGQAETVMIGIDSQGVPDDDAITIFNIDTFRPGYRVPDIVRDPRVGGYLEVFRGSGANWSFVRPAGPESDLVIETTEKRPISDLCCTGLYHFTRAGEFRAAYRANDARPIQELDGSELYVAPLYNDLIARGIDIRYDLIARHEVIFCGVPDEYQAFLAADRP